MSNFILTCEPTEEDIKNNPSLEKIADIIWELGEPNCYWTVSDGESGKRGYSEHFKTKSEAVNFIKENK